ncbi:interleukin-1 receptor-associated kinase 4 isoform X1 [Phycodurus eques]|uniref:interleukin-1 receptor-associated kinase 4 isoform X1 n=1 Tax=Phycodurus eques TaxID=693459 RepID=UPI002ACD261E|nr:interleukin-1 receptor-associated kinase 4 isoform X1 [Phycodurus eques]XP_061533994.1 interleukin-1 receptor-associated kinase 4 isoform X1 [Phycodurus eques]
MNDSVTRLTYIRKLRYSVLCQVADFLDAQDRWKDVIISIRKSDGELRYTQRHVKRFEGLVARGKSPTVELLHDWGIFNATVGELVDILKSRKLLAAASVLLPEEVFSVETQRVSPTAEPNSTHPTLPTLKMVQTEMTLAPVADERQTPVQLENGEPDHAQGFTSFSYNELMEITGNFDERPMSDGGCQLGEGGFGTVFKGFLRDKPVAVKKLNPIDDVFSDELQIQFNQEVQTLTVLKHENLVDMVGYSCDGQYPCLVYAFMANGSLLDRLACFEGSPPLSWRQRCLIAGGTARGVEYLHSNHHVHRDIKSANILLDENLVAKISDFGLTRASAKRTATTMITERIVGTCAYMAPEALRGEITPKSDVFSFGVVLLEILSGLSPADENREPQLLMDMRHDIDDEDEDLTLEAFVDKSMNDWDMSQVDDVYSLAGSCLHERKNRRPLITQVLSKLNGVIKNISLESCA